jgi:hypothetical protein
MITAHATMIYNNVSRHNATQEDCYTTEQEFATVDELENFLAYNRSSIVELTFSGSIKFEIDEE